MEKPPSFAEEPVIWTPKVTIEVTMALLLLLIFADCALAIQFFSGETYSFAAQTPWSAVDGYPTKYTDRVFNWTAPNVDTPTDVAINITITDRGCWATTETVVTVFPKPIGQISLEKSLDGDRKDVLLGDTISYTINITNTVKLMSLTSLLLITIPLSP
jgi:hypothetical protein